MRNALYNATIKTGKGSYSYLDKVSITDLQKELKKVVKEAYDLEYSFGKQMIWDLKSRPANVNKFLRNIITIQLVKKKST